MVVKGRNRKRYDQIWKHSDVQKPEIWSTWKVVKEIIGDKNLEVGSGNYPAIPTQNGYFLDISETAVLNLKKASARASLGSVERIDFPNSFFDSVVAIDVLEHTDDDKKAFSEIARVLKPEGFFLFSVPLGKERFSEIDSFVGHKRRYEIKELITLISKNGFRVMKWRSPSLKYCYVRFLRRVPVFWKIFVRGCRSEASWRFFNIPKFIVNFLVRLTAFVDRLSAPTWQENIKTLESFNGEGIMLLCQKEDFR